LKSWKVLKGSYMFVAILMFFEKKEKTN
jgi:hypothetical protein